MENVLVKKRYKPKKLTTWIFTLYVAFTMSCYLLPSVPLVLPYTFMAPLMLVSFILIFQSIDLIKYSVMVIVTSLFLMFTVLILQDISIVGGVNNALREIRFFLPVLWVGFALNYAEEKQRRFILGVFLVIVSFVIFRTLQAVQVEPMIVRLLAQDKTRLSPEINAFRRSNVAGYTFSYMMGAVVICSTWVTVKAPTKLIRVIGIISLVSSFYFVVETMYATLLILSFVSIMIVLFVHSKNLFVRISLVLFALVGVFFMEEITEWLSELFSFSRVLHIKFADIHNAIKYGDVSEVGSRPQLIKGAIENWIQSPIFGSSTINRAHSTIFSVLQESGIVGLSLWGATLASASKLITKKMKSMDIDTRVFGICVAYIAILSIFNDIRTIYELSIVVFCVVPIFSMFIHKKEEQIKDEI